MPLASEAGHWYARDGTPVYEVRRKDGTGTRPTTLADARKLLLVPSVTGIIKMAAAPGLEVWKQQQMMLSALTLPREPDEKESDWLKRVIEDSKETARKAAETGKYIHGSLEKAITGQPVPLEHEKHVVGALDALENEFGHIQWEAEKSFAHPLGYGGKVDLHCTSAVVDFKTKEFDDPSKLQTWDEHHMQLAGYSHGLRLHDPAAAICYVSTTVPGLCKVIPVTIGELDRGWEMFIYLLGYWKAKNNYRSGF